MTVAPASSVDERELIARVRAGDGLAERALYDAHVNRVYRLAYRLAGDDDLARDFTQETFIRAFDRLPAFRRSEERRVGKECRSRWWAYRQKTKDRVSYDRREWSNAVADLVHDWS